MKKKIIILLSFIGLFLVGGFIVFAATVKIEYKYNSSLDAPTFDYTLSGTKLSIVKNANVSDKSTIDLVLPNDITISEDEVSVSSSKYNVYTNLEINKTYTLSATASNVYIFANNLLYSDNTNTIYQNEYISSLASLDMANYSKYYNNLFDYFENNDKEYSQRFIFIDDVTIDTEYSITRPISLDILMNVELTLKANLNILNTHAGNYYLNNSGKISPNNDTKINLKASKASYLINDNIEAYINSDEKVSLSDAQNFIINYIPNYLVKDIYLPKSYMSSDIMFNYEIGTDLEKEEFTGSVSDKTGKYTMYITILDGEEEISLTKDVILGNTDECLLMVLNNELNDSNLFKDYDLLNLINSLNIKRDLSLKLDNAYFVYNSINSSKEISLKYDGENKLFKLDETSINSLVIRRRLSSSNVFNIKIGEVSQTIYLSDITKEEKVSYLKDYLHTYVVTKNNSPYDIIYVNENKTYLGRTLLFDGLLFDDLNYKILDLSNNEYKGITFNFTNGSITFDNPEDDFDILYLTYFDGDEELFKVDIKRSLNGSSGENSDFESNNPFDILFTDETNWLETNTFEMPANYSEFYANISIISINGVSYNYDVYTDDMTVRGNSYEVKTHNMISITKDNVLGTTNYAKKINIVIDPNYIPSTNSIVSIRCELYNNGDGAKTVTAIHNYTLTIPGILKCGTKFNSTSNYSPYIFSDIQFYNEIISYLKNQNMNDYYQEANETNYILANFKYLEKFDLGIESSNELDISGIEMLTNATSIVLDNINLKDLTPFRYFTSDSLKTLSLKNCTLNYNKVQSNLYSLELNNLDLSDNDLSDINSFMHMFFRTIKIINLDNTKIKTIQGIDDVISIETLYIRNNIIDSFESLKYLKNLKDVYLDGNTNTSDYYGTNGLINQCVYYWMLKTNKTNIYLTDSSLYTIDTNIEPLILALNAFVIPTKIGEKEKAYLKEKFASFNTESIKFEIVSFESGKLIIKASEDSCFAYREFYYEEA